MKYSWVSTRFRPWALAIVFVGCSEQTKDDLSRLAPPARQGGISYVEGKGLDVSEQTITAIGVHTIAVHEGEIVPRLLKTGTVLEDIAARDDGALVVAVWMNGDQADAVRVGQEVLVAGGDHVGVVSSISAPDPHLMGDREVRVHFPRLARKSLPARVPLIFSLPRTTASTLIPKSAVLTTASGSFAYVPNGRFFLRIPVTTGHETGDRIEISDGLYPGDEVVVAPVMTLWLAELQATKGGVSCADGH